MTVSTTIRKTSYVGTGANTPLSTGFVFFDSAEIKVFSKVTATAVETTLVEGTHYSVTGGGTPPATGTVTPIDGATDFPVTVTWTLYRRSLYTQTLDYLPNDSFPAETHEAGLDHNILLDQEHSEEMSRSLRIPHTESVSGFLPSLVSRASKILGFDSAGAPVAVAATSTLEEPFDVKDFGAIGDGLVNDTAAFQAAADQGGLIDVPDGTYLLDSVSCTKAVNWRIAPGAILKQRTAVLGDTEIFRFDTGSDYSEVTGGIFDGDYATHVGSYTPHWVWTAIRVINGPSYIKIRDIHVRDFVAFGLKHGSGDYALYENIVIEDCGKALNFQNGDYSSIRNIQSFGIGNRTLAIYQHGYEIRDCTGLVVENIRDDDYQPDVAGLEPSPGAVTFQRLTDSHISGLMAHDFSGSGYDPDGFNFSNMRRCTIERLVTYGYSTGFVVSSSEDTTIDGFSVDCNFQGGTNPGIRLRAGGLYEKFDATGAVVHNARAVSGCRNFTLSNGAVIRSNDTGVLIQTGEVQVENVISLGNLGNGFRTDESLESGLFVNPITPVVEHVGLTNCHGIYNDLVGCYIQYGRDIHVTGGIYSNNGQDGAAANTSSGIRVGNDAGIARILIDGGVELNDTQAWTTKTHGASFEPGTTDADDQYTISLIDPHQIQIGMTITLGGAAAGPADITGKVVEKHLDDVTIETAAPATFVDTTSLTALTGTFTSNGYDLTGDGAALLETEIIGPTWVYDAGNAEYRRIRRVNSDTVGVIEEAFTTPLAGATLNKIEVDVDGNATQRNGLRLEDAALDVRVGNVRASGNSVADLPVATVASASPMTLPFHNDYIEVSGTADITSITADQKGRTVTLNFTGNAAANGIVDGSNLKLAGDLVYAADDTLTLACDGTDWYETTRSRSTYVEENAGTAVMLNGNPTIVVAHGLSATPTHVLVTAAEDDANLRGMWVDTIGAANFTINGIGNVGADRDIFWEAKVI